MAVLRSLGRMLCFATILASSMMLSNVAYAGQSSQPVHRAGSKPLPPFAPFVAEASRRFNVPEQWIRAVMHIESHAKPQARSFRGAMGLMQIMPGTWNELRLRHRLGIDPYDPNDNIMAGTAYLRELHDRYGTPGFFAAYNAGPGRYERHLATSRSLPEETRAYVAVLAPAFDRAPTKGPPTIAKSFAWTSSPLFAVRSAGFSHDLRAPINTPETYSRHVHAVVDRSAFVPQSGNLFVRFARPSRSP
jgi:hypothetical protein